MGVATFFRASLLLEVSGRWYVDWLILFFIAVIWVAAFFLSKRNVVANRRRRSRELAEKIIRKSKEPYEYIPVEAQSVTGLRLNELQQSTETLERLGFRRLSDHRLLGKGETIPHSFARNLVNEDLHCFADLIAIQKTLDARGPLIFGFSTFFEAGWSIGASSSGYIAGKYYRRVPRSLSLIIRDCDLEELLRRHLAMCDRVMRDLGVSVLQDVSLEGYRQRLRERMSERRQAFLQRDILAETTEAKRIEAQGHWEWLGDYPRFADRNRGKQTVVTG
ncbi:MAG TPA: hypothetical protein VKP58_09765 [Candidatus Acidoferrum sp.]|nr:hypothetical protein [Candidatus Acidoferrum sp.]